MIRAHLRVRADLRAMAILPPPLSPGDTIAIVRTARDITGKELQSGVRG